jgi:hypothetical protein
MEDRHPSNPLVAPNMVDNMLVLPVFPRNNVIPNSQLTPDNDCCSCDCCLYCGDCGDCDDGEF